MKTWVSLGVGGWGLLFSLPHNTKCLADQFGNFYGYRFPVILMSQLYILRV